MEPSLLRESAIGIPHAAQVCVAGAFETLAESAKTGDVSRIPITSIPDPSLPRADEATLSGR
jgi:hypothetical protein